MGFESDMKLSSEFVARACQTTAPTYHKEFARVHADSRTVRPGDLFVALKGEKFDAHDFIPQAIEAGAQGILCDARYKSAGLSSAFFPVDDVLAAYRTLAQWWRQEFALPLIAIAGSVGKTTTKEMIAALLTGRTNAVLKTQGSQNGFVGIPQTLLNLRSFHGAAAIEIGIDACEAMESHLTLVQPTISVVTSIAEEHLEQLRDLETVAREESLALSWVAEHGGAAVWNADDPWLGKLASRWRGQAIGVTLERRKQDSAEWLSGNWDRHRQIVELTGLGLTQAEFAVPLPGEHNARNLALAIGVMLALNFTEDEIRTGLMHFTPPSGRSELRVPKKGLEIWCDYYNASPSSMRAGFRLIAESNAKHKWLCLGDMLELGEKERDFHADLVDALLATKPTGVFLFGPRMEALHAALKKKKFSGTLQHFDSHDKMADAVKASLRSDDAVLIKGSRGMKLERVYEALEKTWK